MKQTVLLGAIFLCACNPPAVDPNATFTIQGKLTNALGQPAAGATANVLKKDSSLADKSDVLGYVDISGDFDPDGTYPVTAAADGSFSLQLKGRDVNTDGGGGAAYLAVLYQDSGDPNLATLSEWYSFSNQNPTWNAGELKLWDGGIASQIGSTLTFDWGQATMPAGESRDVTRPYNMRAFNTTAVLQQAWAEHSSQTSVTVPRLAFKNLTSAPSFFITAFAKPSGGSQTYQHRTRLKQVSSGSWVTNQSSNTILITGVRYGPTHLSYAATGINDDNLDTLVGFYGSATGNTTDFQDLYIDLGAVQSLQKILVYNLGVANLDNAIVSLESSSDGGSAVPATWTSRKVIQGENGFGNWLYIQYEGAASARWLHLSALAKSSGASPYFAFVSEVKVLN